MVIMQLNKRDMFTKQFCVYRSIRLYRGFYGNLRAEPLFVYLREEE